MRREQRDRVEEQQRHWQATQMRPWFTQLVRWARADGLALHCEEYRLPFSGEVFARATLLDPTTRLAVDTVDDFLVPADLRRRHRAFLDEAKQHTPL